MCVNIRCLLKYVKYYVFLFVYLSTFFIDLFFFGKFRYETDFFQKKEWIKNKNDNLQHQYQAQGSTNKKSITLSNALTIVYAKACFLSFFSCFFSQLIESIEVFVKTFRFGDGLVWIQFFFFFLNVASFEHLPHYWTWTFLNIWLRMISFTQNY